MLLWHPDAHRHFRKFDNYIPVWGFSRLWMHTQGAWSQTLHTYAGILWIMDVLSIA